MHHINKGQLTILVDHALLLDLEVDRSTLASSFNALRLPFLKQMLTSRGQPQFFPCDEDALSSSFDSAFSYAMNTPHVDGLSARAQLAYQTQLAQTAVSSHLKESPPNTTPNELLGYALVHLCHWQVGGGHVIMNNAKSIDTEDMEAFRKKLEPLFTSEGFDLLPYRSDTWIARSLHLRNLPSASYTKVMNDDVLPWLIGSPHKNAANQNDQLEPSIQKLRRLQSEVQMVLYDQSQSAPKPGSFNSIWFSGTGDLPEHWKKLSLLSPSESSQVELYTHSDSQILCLHGLTQHMQNFDLNTWRAQFEELDKLIFKSLLETAKPQIILCGKSGFRVWTFHQLNPMQRGFQALKEKIFGPISTLQLLT